MWFLKNKYKERAGPWFSSQHTPQDQALPVPQDTTPLSLRGANCFFIPMFCGECYFTAGPGMPREPQRQHLDVHLGSCQSLPTSAVQTQGQGLVTSRLKAGGTCLESTSSLGGGWWKHLRLMPAQGKHLWSWHQSKYWGLGGGCGHCGLSHGLLEEELRGVGACLNVGKIFFCTFW